MKIPQGTQLIVDKLNRIALYLTEERMRLPRPDARDFQQWADITDAIAIVEETRRAVEFPFKGKPVLSRSCVGCLRN